MTGEEHTPVLLHEVTEWLRVRSGGVYVDATVGLGGHATAIAALLGPGRLICIDRDESALDTARARLAAVPAQTFFHHSDYRYLPRLLRDDEVCLADGILFDLGVSSRQLDSPERGFSYHRDAPLDMRMNRRDPLTARDIVNDWPAEALARILYDYGEETYTPLIVRGLLRAREKAPVETTAQLVGIVLESLPPAARRTARHPARRVFQALRIAVNDELDGLTQALQAAHDLLKTSGRLAVITFHSLEDRRAKTAMRAWARGCVCPPEVPVCVCGQAPTVRLLTKKPITAASEETERNHRARGAKLRVCEKL